MTHAHPEGAKTVQVKCARCSTPFTARTADRARGWGKFCSKSCKAIKQTQVGTRKRHDGISEMTHKKCDTCGAPAINGVYTNDPDRPIEWGCRLHHDTTPITASHGQWE
ncbi:MAG TPA: hypothetical protein VF638_03065 [Sphingomonas sp.]